MYGLSHSLPHFVSVLPSMDKSIQFQKSTIQRTKALCVCTLLLKHNPLGEVTHTRQTAAFLTKAVY